MSTGFSPYAADHAVEIHDEPSESRHVTTRRWKSARPTGTVYGSDCSCGDLITGATAEIRERDIRRHQEANR